MQLGELQSQYQRFLDRGVSVVALSVDPPAHSTAMIRRMGLQFALVSDEDQRVMKAFGVQNPQTQELALHAVYLVDENLRVFYRKVASRRPLSQELLDAIDFERGRYPIHEEGKKYAAVSVAFPRNNFQALIELSTRPASVEDHLTARLEPIIAFMVKRQSDDATVAFRLLAARMVAAGYSEEQMLRVAATLVNAVLALPAEAVLAGRSLNTALIRQRTLRQQEDLNHQALDVVQKDLDVLRALIRNNAVRWNLRSGKTMLRSYRELSLAALRE